MRHTVDAVRAQNDEGSRVTERRLSCSGCSGSRRSEGSGTERSIDCIQRAGICILHAEENESCLEGLKAATYTGKRA